MDHTISYNPLLIYIQMYHRFVLTFNLLTHIRTTSVLVHYSISFIPIAINLAVNQRIVLLTTIDQIVAGQYLARLLVLKMAIVIMKLTITVLNMVVILVNMVNSILEMSGVGLKVQIVAMKMATILNMDITL